MAETQQPILIYDRIGANRRNTFLLLAIFVVLLAVASINMGVVFGFVVGVPYPFAPLLIIPVLIIALLSYYYSAGVALAISQAREVTKDDEPELFRTVENLCIGAGLPMPKLYVIEDGSPNAFATGRDPDHAAIVVTRGLLQKLEKLELEAVIAHELTHIGNYDIRVMTIVVVLVGMAALMADLAMRFTIFGAGRRSSNRDSGGGALGAIVFTIALAFVLLTPIVARLIRFAISRQREFQADASGALLCRNPDALARALAKISADPDPLEVANKATAHLYINNPLREHKSFLNNRFATHPPIEERLAALAAMGSGISPSVLLREAAEAAAAVAKSAEPGQPGTQEQLFRRGMELGDKGRWQEAIAEFDRAITMNQRDGNALAQRGFAYAELARTDRAIADLEKAIALTRNPDTIADLEADIKKLRAEVGGVGSHLGKVWRAWGRGSWWVSIPLFPLLIVYSVVVVVVGLVTLLTIKELRRLIR